jgi:hypothetical protein
MSEKQDYYKASLELSFGFLIESIEEKEGCPMDGLLILILSAIQLDRTHHKKLTNYEEIITSVQNVLQPLLNKV